MPTARVIWGPCLDIVMRCFFCESCPAKYTHAYSSLATAMCGSCEANALLLNQYRAHLLPGRSHPPVHMHRAGNDTITPSGVALHAKDGVHVTATRKKTAKALPPIPDCESKTGIVAKRRTMFDQFVFQAPCKTTGRPIHTKVTETTRVPEHHWMNIYSLGQDWPAKTSCYLGYSDLLLENMPHFV
jgi:hypothetical protein